MRPVIVFLLTLAHSIAWADTLAARVVRVTDGDTIVVLDANNIQHKIRLTGIDAPERKQAFGTKSKEHLSDLVAGKYVVVDYDKRDHYERMLGKILLSDQDMNLEQVNAGLAWHYKKYQGEQTIADRVKYTDAELDARRNKRGLWRDPAPIPPWEYRDMKRETIKNLQPFMGKPEVMERN